jgi:hypothetical protein
MGMQVINIYITKLTWNNLARQETYVVLNLLGQDGHRVEEEVDVCSRSQTSEIDNR